MVLWKLGRYIGATKDGFINKVETELHRQQNTYYVRGLVAFELTETNSTYAMNLMLKHFANEIPLPKSPYVKRLFTVLSNCWDRCPKQLDEFPGVAFPDLCSLDGCLRHWGTHEITRDKTLYAWINEEGEEACKRTYRELHANASCIAQKLLTSLKPVINPGDHVLLVHVPGLDFIDAFFGCLRATILHVPVLSPDPLQRGGQTLLKIENIAKSCNAKAILSNVRYHGVVRTGSVKKLISLANKNGKNSARWPNFPWIHTDSLVKNSKDAHTDDNNDYSEPSAGIRYWARKELSESTFGNKLEIFPGKKYTRTGDLGRLIDGNLFITGRIKDLIIVAGRNIYSEQHGVTVASVKLIKPRTISKTTYYPYRFISRYWFRRIVQP